MEEALTRAEHNEFVKRIEAEEHRQNRRLAELEESTKQINLLVTSVEKLYWDLSQLKSACKYIL